MPVLEQLLAVKLRPGGSEAVAAVQRGHYDLVLMDVQMPEMDGLVTTRCIIERLGSDRPRIVALTADAMQDDRERCLAAGMDDYLAQPIRPAELAEALEHAALERAAQPEEVPLDPEALDRLIETAGGDPEFVGVLLDSFNDDAPAILEELRGGLSADDDATVRRAAHTLKSNAATIGATALAALCADLEARARDGDLQTAKRPPSAWRLPTRPFALRSMGGERPLLELSAAAKPSQLMSISIVKPDGAHQR